MKFVLDLFKPILTALVTLVAGAVLVSVFWPAGDSVIEHWIPAWAYLDPAIAWLSEQIGQAPAAEPAPVPDVADAGEA